MDRQQTILYRGISPYCDHGSKLIDRCPHCEAAERRLEYRPTVSWDHFGRQVLGSCSDCGTDVLVSGHLFKACDGRYLCEECAYGVEDCAR